jgi:hypothetical protein
MTDAAPKFVYRTVGEDGIDAVQPLWKQATDKSLQSSPAAAA